MDILYPSPCTILYLPFTNHTAVKTALFRVVGNWDRILAVNSLGFDLIELYSLKHANLIDVSQISPVNEESLGCTLTPIQSLPPKLP